MPGHQIEITRDVAASPEAVWTVLTDVHHAAETLTSVTRVEVLTDGPYAVGTRWRETRTMFGKEATEELWVTEVEAPRRTTVEGDSSGVHYVTVFTLSPLPTGTRLAMVFSGEQENPSMLHKAAWVLFGRMGLKASAKMMTRDLEDIAARAESA